MICELHAPTALSLYPLQRPDQGTLHLGSLRPHLSNLCIEFQYLKEKGCWGVGGENGAVFRARSGASCGSTALLAVGPRNIVPTENMELC